MHINLISPFVITRYVPPILWVTIALIAGIEAAFLVSYVQIVLIFFISACTWAGLIYRVEYRSTLFAIPAALLFLLGFGRTLSIKKTHEKTLNQVRSKDLCYQVFINDIVPLTDNRFNYLITMQAIRAFNCHETIKLNGSIMCYCKNKPDFAIGDTMAIPNVKIKKSSSESYGDYCVKEGILGTVCFYKPIEFSYKESSNSLAAVINRMRIAIFDRIKTKMSRTAFSFFSSFFLGNRISDKKENDLLKQDCKLWGISHYLARSGLHLVVFILVWQHILRFIAIPLIFKQILLLLLTIIYYLLSWSSISFVRALITLIFYKSYELTNTLSHTVHVITLATLVTLIYNPFYLFFLDFQLSYSITFFLALIRHLHTIQLRKAAQNH